MSRANTSPTLIGSGVAFVTFLLTGAVPSLVYGGYVGLIAGSAIFGHGTSDHLGTRLLTGSGMVLGLVLTLFVYLTVGALVGHFVGAALRRHAPKPEPEAARAGTERG